MNALPTVTFNTIESLVIDGQGGGDTLTVTTPAGGNFISYTPGAAPDSGTIAVTTSASIHTALVPLSFQHIGTTGNVTFDTGDHNRNDILNLYGTNNSDIFTLAASTGQARITNFSVAAVTDVINTATINQINLLGLNGDDNFNITGPQPYEFITVDGGDPSASDAVNLSGANSAVIAHFGDSTSSSPLAGIDGYGSQIILNGIEVANLDANGQTLKINWHGSARCNLLYSHRHTCGHRRANRLKSCFQFLQRLRRRRCLHDRPARRHRYRHRHRHQRRRFHHGHRRGGQCDRAS